MAALASSLIRQRREVKDPQANRQITNKRKPCPKSNKSLCQKQILILISKVRLCGTRGRKLEKRPDLQLYYNKAFVFAWRDRDMLMEFFCRCVLCDYVWIALNPLDVTFPAKLTEGPWQRSRTHRNSLSIYGNVTQHKMTNLTRAQA
ncbi:putative fibroblast growth factor 11 [Triplophysa rosa]|uniref:Fibroblast growth factor 11 n=1 Tax=Triplophysa rosa TaxID=992332 RepID=A0A9W7X3L0_TRIRA|nr:putative fibroblast growth factor 11 [Triplophysa rosa]